MLDCTSALGRVCRTSTRCICSWPHAKPAPFLRLLLLLQYSSRMWRLIQSFLPSQSLSPFHRLNQYPLTITSSLGLSARVSSQISPRQFHFARAIHNTANRLVTVTIPSLLARSDLASLSGIPRAKIARVLLRTLKRRLLQQQPLGKLSSSRFGSQNRLFCKSSLITRLRLPVSAARTRRGLRRTAPHSSSPRSDSLLRLSVASGTLGSNWYHLLGYILDVSCNLVDRHFARLRTLVNIAVMLPARVRRLPSAHSLASQSCDSSVDQHQQMATCTTPGSSLQAPSIQTNILLGVCISLLSFSASICRPDLFIVDGTAYWST